MRAMKLLCVLASFPLHSGLRSVFPLPAPSRNREALGQWWSTLPRNLATILIAPILFFGSGSVFADDELAKYAAEGNAVAVDGECFLKKCSIQTSRCASDQNCLKGLSCLARCKGGSMCSTGCFAKYGSEKLDELLSCTVEKNDCVHVPGRENMGWAADSLADLPSRPLKKFDISLMQGQWYKVMGLDSRYDCFDCQKNSFNKLDDSTLKMEALFRIPRPTFPGYLQTKIVEELHVADKSSNPLASLQSKGEMFGLTFWENWYIMDDQGEIRSPITGFGIQSAYAETHTIPEMQLVFYTGHTLQGSYKGAFLYSRSPEMGPESIEAGRSIIRRAGLDPNKFCLIRNQCFLRDERDEAAELKKLAKNEEDNFWFLGQKFFRVTQAIAAELSDWFQDPEYLSDWLVSQQEHMVLEQPLVLPI